MVEDHVVEVFSAEEGVAVSRFHLKHSTGDLEDGDIEGTSSEIVHGDSLAVFGGVHAVGESGGSRLVDDALDVEPGDLAGVFGGLTLRVIEVSRNGDDSVADFLAEVVLCGFLHFSEHESSHLARGVLFALGFHPGITVFVEDFVGHGLHVLLGHRVIEATADETLGGENSVFRVLDGLALRGGSDKHRVVSEGDEGRCRPRTLGVFDNTYIFALHHSDTAVRGTQIDTDDLASRGEGASTRSKVGSEGRGTKEVGPGARGSDGRTPEEGGHVHRYACVRR
mmetsp:Transcript_8803/g.16189  ORF Transcript_8803/g.16189 Transcript_8803/m.16189 type:complete len:281 (+) Transcript_8803:1580-2422(+)